MLTIERWSGFDKKNPSDGISWWIIRNSEPDKSIPSPTELKRKFARCSNSGIELQVEKLRHRRHFFVGMQVGLPRSHRTKFLEELEKLMN